MKTGFGLEYVEMGGCNLKLISLSLGLLLGGFRKHFLLFTTLGVKSSICISCFEFDPQEFESLMMEARFPGYP